MRRWERIGDHSHGKIAAGIGTEGNWRWKQLLRLAPALKTSLGSWWILPKQLWAETSIFGAGTEYTLACFPTAREW